MPLAWLGRVVSLAVLVVVSFSSLLGHHVGRCVEGTSHDPLDRTSCVLGHLSLIPGATQRLNFHPRVLA
jgi:hypothetical protein